MEKESDKKDFFISYNRNDEKAAEWIAWQLEEAGYTTFIQAWDFRPGNNFVAEMDKAVKKCERTIAVLSENYLQSGFTKAEWTAAFAKDPTGEKRLLIPIRVKDCDVEGLLGQIIYIDLVVKEDKNYIGPVCLKEKKVKKKLLDEIQDRLKPAESPPFNGFGNGTRPVSAGIDSDEILKKRGDYLKEVLEKAIKSNYHMELNLEQEIEKEIEVEDEKTGEIEKRKELVWEAVELEKILTDQNNYILINPSGMGKTTFLTHAASKLLEIDNGYKFLPFITTCIDLNQRGTAISINDFIQKNLESTYYNSQTSLIDKEWENLCILMDALDQARDVNDIVSSLLLQNQYCNYKKAKIILSSRQNTADKVREGFNKIRLKLPEDDEVRHYLGEKHYNNLKSLIDSSRELVTVPVLLEMLRIISERGDISAKIDNRTSLYSEFTRILIDQERNKPRYWQNPPLIDDFIDSELEESLEKIAFFSLANHEILEIGKDKLIRHFDSPEKKYALLNAGILLELFEDRELKLIFRHQSFQAYFAARYIYNRQPEYFNQLTNDIAFFYSDIWYEVLRFFIGLVKDPQKAEEMIHSIYQQKDKKDDLNHSLRLIFAFFLMSETRVSNEKVLELYKQLGNLLKNNVSNLEFIKSNIDKFNTGNRDQRRKTDIILKLLLKDDYWYTRKVAVEVLGKIGISKDIPLLKKLLKDKS
ncbi:MAG: TIR domain-containing protein [Candidatus Aminicenantes bacterium]|nr:TIR domain-containing protein [Candidatus Aminicenantes bacterium]NIM77800.1 TIR domain-containing protein [Candidatus Aminicenantes bacterium]NIN17113.1 TIR domain-containing protein [Candidatus Aminicenantes bacterium]NIN41006.1 TIR domain-containing protein [Candidatus Aminicenantes bacterium]NIN83811.1 TIR domain-containing protein [Candidatus Aminicenantes bacterium]